MQQVGFEPTTLGLEDRCSIQLSYCCVLDNLFSIEKRRVCVNLTFGELDFFLAEVILKLRCIANNV